MLASKDPRHVRAPRRAVHADSADSADSVLDMLLPANGTGSMAAPAFRALLGQLASWLVAIGVKPEDQVLIAPLAVPEMVAAILAVARCGARAVPLAQGLPAQRPEEIVALSLGRVMIAGSDGLAPQGLQQVVTLADLSEAASARTELPAPNAVDGAIVVYGATGQGAVFSQAALVSAARGIVARYGLGPGDRVLPVAPVGGAEWLTWALASLAAGAHLLDAPQRARADWPEDWALAIAAARPTVLIMPDPQQMLALLQDDVISADSFPALRYLRTSGPADILRRVTEDFPQARLIHAYASPLVAGLPICTDPRDPPATAQSTCGRPLPGIEVMIVDSASGKDLPLYEIGEIWLRGGQVFSGFLHQPSDAVGALQADGFLRTGDQGYLDREGRVVLL